MLEKLRDMCVIAAAVKNCNAEGNGASPHYLTFGKLRFMLDNLYFIKTIITNI